MRFGIFYEHQLPRPWHEGDELKLFQDALDQVELADKIGIDHAWEVEHHFLEEYSHSSAPEVFLAACSQRTKNIRLGHGITLMPPNYNHPHAWPNVLRRSTWCRKGVEWAPPARRCLNSAATACRSSRSVRNGEAGASANMMAMDPIPAMRASSSRCHAATSCLGRRSGRIRRSGCVFQSRDDQAVARLGIGALTFAFVDPVKPSNG